MIFRGWVDSIPNLTPSLRTPASPDGVVDRRDVPYALRHTYAQRHADANTPGRRARGPARSPRRRRYTRLLGLILAELARNPAVDIEIRSAAVALAESSSTTSVAETSDSDDCWSVPTPQVEPMSS